MYTLKKSLGQHFLRDENISKKIVAALQQCSFQNLLEVGPGAGALTKYLLQLPQIEFKAVEIDQEKVDHLVLHFPELKNKLIHQSFLEIEKPFEKPFALIGNFPYNISTEILFKVIEWKQDIECVIGMFQKEVAQRIAAKEGSKVYGVTSVLTQTFFNVEYLFEVNEGSFQPPPKVKSAVIRLSPLKNKFAFRSEQDLFKLVKTAFNQRRKTLRNATKEIFDKEVLDNKLFDQRAEQLSPTQFAELTFKMK